MKNTVLPAPCGATIRDNARSVLAEGALSLEPLAQAHAPDVLAAVQASLGDLHQWLGDSHDMSTVDEAAAYVALREQKWAGAAEYWFAVCDAGAFVGIAFLNTVHPVHHFANLGYWIRSDRAGRGYATRATRMVARFGFEQLGLHRIEIVMEAGNHASRRVAEKAGATFEGVLRNRLCGGRGASDALLFSLIPSDI